MFLPVSCAEEKASQARNDEVLDPSVSDSTLMERVACADARAFVWLMQRHLKTMVALAQRMTGNASDADEIAQEAFMRLWVNAPKWDVNGTAAIRTWLSRVVVNLCLDLLRRRRGVPLDEAMEIPDGKPDGFDLLREGDKKKLINAAMDELPPRQRVAVALSYFEEMSGAEVAAAMALSLRAVESLLVRARRTLRARFAKIGITGGDV